MRSLRLLPSLALGLGVFAFAGVASATPGQTLTTGKGGGGTCTGCHGTNTPAPSFAISIADQTVMANSTVDVTLTVNGSLTLTSFDAAFDVDAVITPGTGTRGVNGNPNEVVASTPLMGANGTYTFSVKVPNRNGSLNLWVAGLSANNDGDNTGDRAGSTVVQATITGSDAGVTEPPVDPTDPGTSSGGATASTVDAGPPVIIAHPILPDGDPGCQLAPGRAPDVLAMVGIGAALLGLRRRTSRRRRPDVG